MTFLQFLLTIALIAFALAFIIYFLNKAEKDEKDEKFINSSKEDQELLREIYNKHKYTLRRKFEQTVYLDDYDNKVLNKWHSEIDYFIKNVIEKYSFKTIDNEYIFSYIDSRTNEAVESKSLLLNIDFEDLSPEEFENHCSYLLKESNWDARVTRKTGDQGVDIIAVKNGIKVVFQCKKYSAPVGNSAVQEIIAGKIYENADFAVVVTNSTYTKSARQLAQTAGVKLIHIEALSNFEI